MVKPIVAAVAAVLFVAPAFAQTLTAPPPPPAYACDGAAHRAFDFWLGAWDAYVTGTENLAGKSLIESADRGCVITEQWQSVRNPYSGRSLNAFDVTTGRWVQVWMDSGGEITRFEGRPAAAGSMVLTATAEKAPGRAAAIAVRMSFTRNVDGSVRQFGEQSTDGGATWTASYDFTYRRRPE